MRSAQSQAKACATIVQSQKLVYLCSRSHAKLWSNGPGLQHGGTGFSLWLRCPWNS